MPLLKQGGSHERFSSLIHLLEPLGKVRPNIPSFPTVYSAKSAANVTLLCPAQAYPKPSYRYFPSYLVCSGKGTSINILLIFFFESLLTRSSPVCFPGIRLEMLISSWVPWWLCCVPCKRTRLQITGTYIIFFCIAAARDPIFEALLAP